MSHLFKLLGGTIWKQSWLKLASRTDLWVWCLPFQGSEEDRKLLIKAKKERFRSLGNMQFIGHLFKEGMLTEKIIHQCIIELLREEVKPKPEDIECLCKLVATVGRRLQQRSELKAYFIRAKRLAENKNLDVRHRFMLLDLIEMKDRGWVERRAQEGPKTIEEIHKEAAKEQMAARDRGRGGHWGQSRSRHPDDSGRGPWRGAPPPPPGRPGPSPSPTPPLMRGEEVRPLTKMRSLGRTDSLEISLRPGAMGRREPAAHVPRRPGSPPKAPVSEQPSLSTPPQPKVIQEEKTLTGEALERKVKSVIEEFYEIGDMDEAVKCVEELKAANVGVPDIIAISVEQALNIRGMEASKRLLPLADLMIALCEESDPVVKPEEMEKGVEETLMKIPEIAEDFPKAPHLVARLLGILVAQDIISLQKIGSLILAGGSDGEDPPLVDSGAGSVVIGGVMKEIKEVKETEGVQCIRGWLKSERVDISQFYPSYERDSVKPEDVLKFLDE